MAKTCVAIPTAIWSDPDFTRMRWQTQRLYLLMLTQRETTPAGTLPLRTRRWARFSADAAPETITENLAELEQTGWALVDRGSEEVALRMLTPPAGHKQLQAALSAASRIESLPLRLGVMNWLAAVGYDGRHALGTVERDSNIGRYRVRILELDHVYPESLGGKFELDNLQTLCNSCNARKGAQV